MNEGNKKNKGFGIGKVIVALLVILGALFLILLFLPDDEEESSEPIKAETGEEYDAGGSEKNGSGKTGSGKTESEENGSGKTGSGKIGSAKGGSGKDEDDWVEPVSPDTRAESATVMIYMNGSDLETEAGEGTMDIAEMLDSGIGDNVNVIIQTMGTRDWQDYDISSDTSQRYRVRNGEIELLEDDLGQLDCTDPGTLSGFIGYGKKNFPADRYIFIFWDHGGGPVYGFGFDEWQEEEASLTLDEIKKAFSEHPDVHFDIIGMDCCIMANIETCYVLAPFCKYALLSEDFESGLGWEYMSWMKSFEEDPGISTPLLGKRIIDGIIEANEGDTLNGDSSTMILVNERAVSNLMEKWKDYAYENSESLFGANYSRLHKAKGRSFIVSLIEAWATDMSDVTLSDFYVSDILSIVESVGKEGKKTDDLRSALKACAAYFGQTGDSGELTGLAVSLPYGDMEYYKRLSEVYSGCGFDKEYIKWLKNFVNAEGSDNYHDYSDFIDSWEGWGSYEDGFISSLEDEEDLSDWTYDYDNEVWYLYEDGVLYLYDDETDTISYYDEDEDQIYYYDEDADEWILQE